MHDFLTVGAPAPLQDAAAVGYSFDDAYYAKLARGLQGQARVPLRRADARPDSASPRRTAPTSSWPISPAIDDRDDVTFAKWLTKEVKVATVPGSSFYRPGAADGKHYIRFAFCKKHETLERAVENLSRLKAIV